MIKFGSLGLVGLFLLIAGGKGAWGLWKATHPDPPAPPNVAFGKLPAIQFPEGEEKVEHRFSLETPDGALPDFGDRVNVYFIPHSSSMFLALDRAKQVAKSLSFPGEPTKLKEGVYLFTDEVGKELTMNALTGNFEINYPYLSDQTLIDPPSLDEKAEAIKRAKNYLSKSGKITDDIMNGKSKVTYQKIMPEGLVDAPSLSEGDVVRVDLFREKAEGKWEVVTTKYGEASISVLLSGVNDRKRRILSVKYRYSPVDFTKMATYPVKPIQQAWEELEKGDYHNASETEKNAVAIRRVKLAYFEPVVGTNFFQPVFMFEGDGDFVAYVPAVAVDWVAE